MARIISTPLIELIEKMSIPEPETEPTSYTLERYSLYIRELEKDVRSLNQRIDDLIRETEKWEYAYRALTHMDFKMGCDKCKEHVRNYIELTRRQRNL